MWSFRPTFSLSSFTFFKRVFGFSLLYAIRVVSFAYLRLLVFLPVVFIPACANRWENNGNSDRLHLGGLQKHCRWRPQPRNQKTPAPWKESHSQHSTPKSRDVTLSTKVRPVKAMIPQVFMHGCENCTTKKAEHRRIDAPKLWRWRKPPRVPWPTRRPNQSVPKEISPEYSPEGRC